MTSPQTLVGGGTDPTVSTPPVAPSPTVTAGGQTTSSTSSDISAQDGSQISGDPAVSGGAATSSTTGGTTAPDTVVSPQDTPPASQPQDATLPPPDPAATPGSGRGPPGSITPDAGGSASSGDGSATVSFAPGLVADTTAVTVVPTTTSVPAGLRAASAVYDFTATDLTTGSSIHYFHGSPVVTIAYDPSKPTPTAIYYLDPVNGPVAIPSTVDTANHTISAALPHFSSYVAASPAQLTVAITPPIVQVDGSGNGTAAVTATVTQDDGTGTYVGVDSAVVNFSITAGASAASLGSTCTTAADGTCSVNLSVTAPESTTIQASVANDAGTVTTTATVPFVTWNTTAPAGTNTITISTSAGSVHVNVNGSDNVMAVSSLASVGVTGGTGSDTFVIDSSLASLGIPLYLAGGGGSDTLQGPASGDASWTLSSVDGGSITSIGGTSTAISWTNVGSLDLGSGANSVTFAAGAGLTGSITGTVNVSLGSFAHVSGSVSVATHDNVSVKEDNGTTLTGVTMTALSLTSGSLFVGSGYGTPSAAGINGTISSLGVAFFSQNSTTWQALQGTFAASITGTPGFTFDASSATVSYNGTGSDGHALDLSQVDTSGGTTFSPLSVGAVSLGSLTASAASVSGTAAVSISNVVAATGTVTVTHSTGVDLSAAVSTLTSADIWTFALTGATLFAGTGGTVNTSVTPYTVTDGSFGVHASTTTGHVYLAQVTGSGVTYTGLDATGLTASLVGTSPISLDVTGGTVLTNTASSGSKIDFSAITFSNFVPVAASFAIAATATTDLSVTGTAGVAIPNIVAATGTVTATHSTGVDASAGLAGLTSADIWTFGLTSATLFAGTGGTVNTSVTPYTVTDGSFGVHASTTTGHVYLAQVTGSGVTYTGLDATGLTASLVGTSPISLDVTGGTVLTNTASSGTTKLDFSQLDFATLIPTAGNGFVIAATAATDLAVSGTAAVAITDVIAATGTVAVTHSTGVDLSTAVSGLTSADIWTFAITGATLFAGSGGSVTTSSTPYTVNDGAVGVHASGSVDFAQITDASIIYTGLDATGLTGDLVGLNPVVLHISGATVLSNAASGSAAKIDFSAITFSSFVPVAASFAINATATTDAHVSGTVALDLAGVLVAVSGFQADHTTVTTTAATNGAAITGGDAWLFQLTGNPTVWAGVGGSLHDNGGGSYAVVDGTVGVHAAATSIAFATISTATASGGVVTPGVTYTGVEIKGLAGDLVGLDPVVLHVSGVEFLFNQATDNTASPAVTTGGGLNWSTVAGFTAALADVTDTTQLHLSGTVALDLAGVLVAVSGFSADHTTVTTTAATNGAAITGGDAWLFQLTGNPTVWAGVGGSLHDNGGGSYAVVDGTVGVHAAATSIAFATISTATASGGVVTPGVTYTGVEIKGLAGDLVGLDPVVLHVSGVEFLFNQATDNTASPAVTTGGGLNWSTVTGFTAALADVTDTTQLHLSGTVALDLAGVLVAVSGFSADHTTVTTTAATNGAAITGGDAWLFQLTGNPTVWAGVGGSLHDNGGGSYAVVDGTVGVHAAATSIAFATISTATASGGVVTPGVTYTGVEIKGLAGDLVGLDPVVLHVSGVEFLFNQATDNTASPAVTTGGGLNWSTVAGFTAALADVTDTTQLHLSGTVALDLAGVLVAVSGFSADHTTVTTTAATNGAAITGGDAWLFQLTGNPTVWAGVGGSLHDNGGGSYAVVDGTVGVHAAATSIAFATISTATASGGVVTPGVTYTGVEIKGLAGDLVGLDPVVLHVSGVEFLFNQATDNTASPAVTTGGGLNWSTVAGFTAALADVTDTTQLHLSGTVALDLAGVLVAVSGF